MRPLALKVQGLTCFRDEVTLDLAPLNLVAIAGPTGAGKSTLLDAMILSLYGFVPRMGSKNLGELISHGRASLSVVFDFAIDAKRYRIARAIHRGKRASQAILSELVDDGASTREVRIASGIKEVQDQVRGLLGIDGEAFTQAVILPQGRFQDFLKATPGDRRKIMNELLGLRVYDLMRARAAELATRHAAKVEGLELQLGDAKDLDEAVLAAREAERGQLAAAREAARAQEAQARDGLAGARTVQALSRRRAQAQDELARLDAAEEAIGEQRERLSRLSRVAPLVPLLERSEDLKVKWARASRLVEEAEARSRVARLEVEEARAKAEAARAAAAGVDVLRQRMAELDALRGQAEALSQARVALERARSEAAQAEAEVARAEDDQSRRARALAEALAAWEGQRARAEALSSPADALEEARARRDRVLALRHALGDLGEREALARGEEAKLTSAEDGLMAAEDDRRQREASETLAQLALREAEAALETFRRAEAAAALRVHLHAGEACPVCEQPVAAVPAISAAHAEADALEEVAATRRQAHQRAAAGAERARREEEGARARLEAARQAARQARDEVARRKTAVQTELAEVLGDEPLATARDGIARFEARLQELEAGAMAWRAAQEGLERAARAHAERQAAAAQAAMAVDFAAQRRRDLVSRVGELEARVRELSAKVLDIDPVAQREQLASAAALLERARDEAQAALAAGQAKLAGAEATEATHRQGEEALQGELARLEQELVVRLEAAALTLDEARELAEEANPAGLTALTRTIEQHDAARAQVAAELVAVEVELAGRTAGSDEVAAWERALAEASAAWEQAMQALAALEAELVQARRRLEQVARVREDLARAREALRVYRRLGEDLRSNQFQEFVLEEVNNDLAAGASQRLLTLSGGRYRLGAGKDGYEVFDEDHGGERRSTDTLSGGETFLASLALALELSEQIQRRSGKVHLDCIFIDEGFGTLDAETLETVAEAVEALGASGRLVGLITHVAELAQRMPDRIMVERAGEGSRVRVVQG